MKSQLVSFKALTFCHALDFGVFI